MTLLALLGCISEYSSGGTAVGNPGRLLVTLAPAEDGAWQRARARRLEAELTDCDGTVLRARLRDVDLESPDAIDVPVGVWCGVSLTVEGLDARSGGGLTVVRDEAATALALDEAPSRDQSWVLELGEPGAPGAIAARSALFVEIEADGDLDELERSRGALAANPGREAGPFDPSLAMVTSWTGARAALVEEGPVYATSGAPGDGYAAIVARRGPDGTTWVAAGEAPTGPLVAVSTDSGLSWTLGPTLEPLSGLAIAGEILYASSFDGGVFSSADGLDWTRVYVGEGRQHRAIASDGGALVVVGDGEALFSADGTSWTVTSLPGAPDLLDVASGPPGFVAVGGGGALWFSPDGLTWTDETVDGALYKAVVWTGRRFVAAGEGASRTSLDGVTWASGPDRPLDALARHRGGLLAVHDDEVWASVDDGDAWTQERTLPELGGLSAIASNDPG